MLHKPYFTMGKKPRPKRTKIGKVKRAGKIVILVVIVIIAFAAFVANRAIMPAVIAIADQRAVVIINDVINDSISRTIAQFGLHSEDFYNLTLDAAGQLSSLSVDTVRINQVASQLAVDISSQLSIDHPTPIAVPIGMLTGIPLFASIGPDIRINIVPTGEATVEYETSFTSAGINQINFQVWLTVEANMRIVVPLQNEVIPVTRRVPLVNTVFAGVVPEGMILTNFGIGN
ncbi:MAG: sporulation protein YunB [Defluviitaleaceae bacterium]|nr:sporulation protein YunB [Defluviitaleaceae bacterium]